MDAEQATANTADEKVAAVHGALRSDPRACANPAAKPSTSDGQSAQVRAYAAEAELWLAQAKAGQKPRQDEAGPGVAGPGKDPKSQMHPRQARRADLHVV